jgi:hypothetical protein
MDPTPQDARAVFLGDAFLYAERLDDSQNAAINVVRIELDGTSQPANTPASTASEWPNLADANGQIYLTYGDFSGSGVVMWVPLDSSGAATGAATPFVSAYEPVPLLSLAGGSARAVLPSGTTLSAVALADPSDTFAIVQAASLPGSRVVPDGDDAVVAWLDSYSYRFGVARIRP